MHDIIFFNFLSISDFLCRFASFKKSKNIYCGKDTSIIRWPPRRMTALQVVRTSFLGPRPRSFPPPHPRCFWVLLGDIFIVPFLGLALGYLTAIATRGGEIWSQLTGIWRQMFKKCQIPTPCPASPAPTADLTLIGKLYKNSVMLRVFDKLSTSCLAFNKG